MARISEKIHAKLFKKLSKLLTNKAFVNKYNFKESHFSRHRKLPFQTTCLLIIRLLKSSLKTEMKAFYRHIYRVDEIVKGASTAAFCKARQKINYQLFIDLYKFLIRFYYTHFETKRWKGFRLLAVDGTAINLPPNEELLNIFGVHHINSIGTEIPLGRVSFLGDILNNLVLDAQLAPLNISEQELFELQLRCIRKKDLVLADRGYGYFSILKMIIKRGADFCIRVGTQSQFIKEFLASGEKDIVIEWIPSERTIRTCKSHKIDYRPIKVRLLRIQMSKNEEEILVTSLLDTQKYDYETFESLYHERWGIEEDIKKFTQRLLIESFSSKKYNGVLQDFYANVVMYNIVSLMTVPVVEEINQRTRGHKHKKQINWSQALGDIRERIELFFLRRNISKIDTIIKSIWDSIIDDAESIRPNRKYPRDKRKKGSRNKHSMAYKRPW